MARRIINIQEGSIDITRWISNQLHVSNLISDKIVEVKADSSMKGDFTLTAPLGLVLNESLYWWNSNSENTTHWYQIDLKSISIHITGYAFDMSNLHYSRSWDLFGTNDTSRPLESWTKIDSKELTQAPDKNYQLFTCDFPTTAQFLHFQTNSSNFLNDTYMTLGPISLFGSFYWTLCSTKQPSIHIARQFIFLLIIINH